MRPRIQIYVFVLVLAGLGGNTAFGAAVHFKLLPLVPPGAQLVSGFENKRIPNATGAGLLVMMTVSSGFDLEDLLALSGVDPKRSFDEIIAASFAPPGETPSEHLLLVTGKFDRAHIFRSAELNGAKPFKYLAEPVLAIEPFTRERSIIHDTRWLTIIENRFVVFGSPWMVKQALNRFENRVTADPILMARLAMFKPDVRCWNLTTSLPKTRQAAFLQSRGPWSDLYDDTELLMVGVHDEDKVRVDLVLSVGSGSGTTNLNSKAAQFSRIFFQDAPRDEDDIKRLRDLQVLENGIQASIVLSAEEFQAWRSRQTNTEKQELRLAREREQRLAASPQPRPTMSAFPPSSH